MSVTMMKKENFDQEVLASEKTVLVDFFATWCGPCRMVGPILEEIAAERPDIKVVKVDVDAEPELAAAFGVMNIPTMVVVKKGKEAGRMIGARPKAEILASLA